MDTNDYSVNPRYIGRLIDVRADLETVVVTCEGIETARHKRCYAAHESHLDAAHAMTLRKIRAEQAAVPAIETEVEERDLSVYDHVLGVA